MFALVKLEEIKIGREIVTDIFSGHVVEVRLVQKFVSIAERKFQILRPIGEIKTSLQAKGC